jgi:hypothetical protein
MARETLIANEMVLKVKLSVDMGRISNRSRFEVEPSVHGSDMRTVTLEDFEITDDAGGHFGK